MLALLPMEGVVNEQRVRRFVNSIARCEQVHSAQQQYRACELESHLQRWWCVNQYSLDTVDLYIESLYHLLRYILSSVGVQSLYSIQSTEDGGVCITPTLLCLLVGTSVVENIVQHCSDDACGVVAALGSLLRPGTTAVWDSDTGRVLHECYTAYSSKNDRWCGVLYVALCLLSNNGNDCGNCGVSVWNKAHRKRWCLYCNSKLVELWFTRILKALWNAYSNGVQFTEQRPHELWQYNSIPLQHLLKSQRMVDTAATPTQVPTALLQQCIELRMFSTALL
uniref:Uncharacterized protein n=1 Tax=Lygus hesperus TaxID=30085 RepID=A0A146M488_LYGHE